MLDNLKKVLYKVYIASIHMSIINFAVTKPLEKQINQVIKDRGFTSKAEFFRFVTLLYLQRESATAEDKRYKTAVNELKTALHAKFATKKLPSLRQQLKISK